MLFKKVNCIPSWHKKRINDISKLVKNVVKPDDFRGEPYVGLEHIGKNTLNLLSIGNSADTISNKYRFSKDQILFGKLRPYFRKVVKPSFDGLCSTDIWVVDKKGEMDINYLFYLFASEEFVSNATASSTGTRMPRASWDFMSNLEINIPPLNEQKKIGDLLNYINEKIKVNNSIITLLDKLCEGIFKRWFVSFELPDKNGNPYLESGEPMKATSYGMIPEGWEFSTVSTLCSSVMNGGTPKRRTAEYWNNGTIKWYKTGELNDLPLIESEENITEQGLAKSSAKLWPKNTILIALYASPTVGRLGILTTEATANQACTALLAKPEIGYPFLFYLLKNEQRNFQNLASGAAQQNISQQIVKDQKVILPTLDVIEDFNAIAETIIDKITNNLLENDALSQLRDCLLPLLLSGEIRVPLDCD